MPYIYREHDIIQWGLARNIIGPDGKATPDSQFLKTDEEVQELYEAIQTNNRADALDAIGDIIVTLALQAHMWDSSLEECIEAAWTQIRDRQGKMVNGLFVKE